MKSKSQSENPIEIRNLTKRFGKTVAVDDLSLTVPEGQVTAFLGSNGAGKTTTIQTLMNLHRPSDGSAEVLGIDSRKLGPAQLREIGYVSENMDLPLWMTVDRFMKYCAPFYPTWDEDFANQLLDEFELPRDRRLRNLSRGMKMKAALIGGIAYRPRLVILDEPFTGLDPLVRDEFIRGLLQLTGEEGWTVFLSSHDIDEVERLADRVVLIDSGKKKMEESVPALLESCRRYEVFFANDPGEAPSPPRHWMDFRVAGRTASFAVAKKVPEADIRSHFGERKIARITEREMSLREVFVAMAANWRKGTKQ